MWMDGGLVGQETKNQKGQRHRDREGKAVEKSKPVWGQREGHRTGWGGKRKLIILMDGVMHNPINTPSSSPLSSLFLSFLFLSPPLLSTETWPLVRTIKPPIHQHFISFSHTHAYMYLHMHTITEKRGAHVDLGTCADLKHAPLYGKAEMSIHLTLWIFF